MKRLMGNNIAAAAAADDEEEDNNRFSIGLRAPLLARASAAMAMAALADFMDFCCRSRSVEREKGRRYWGNKTYRART